VHATYITTKAIEDHQYLLLTSNFELPTGQHSNTENLAPVSRRSVAEALVTVTIALTAKRPGTPEGKVLRQALRERVSTAAQSTRGLPATIDGWHIKLPRPARRRPPSRSSRMRFMGRPDRTHLATAAVAAPDKPVPRTAAAPAPRTPLRSRFRRLNGRRRLPSSSRFNDVTLFLSC
jgi:hypothetical protein